MLANYQRLGQDKARPVMLILHGWGDSSQGWLVFGRAMSHDYAVYLLDLPGFGGSQAPSAAWGLDEYAAFAGGFLVKLRLQPAVIVGHSNGGAIAIRGVVNGTLTCDKLVLLSSAGVRSQYKGRKRLLRVVAKTGKALVMPLPSSVKDRLRRKLYTTVGSDMLVAEHLQATFKKVVNDDVQADAAKLRLPVLLVYGENDVATPPAFGRLLHQRITGSTLEIIGDAEHFVHRDQPKTVLRLVKEFLRQ